jgi:glutamine amidotransferase
VRALILNYGVGNIFSISSALKRKNLEVDVSSVPRPEYDLIVFPGVGAFSSVSNFLRSYGETLNRLRKEGSSFLGICLGMQVMFQSGSEGGGGEGLGWFQGKIEKLQGAPKLPHIGWDRVQLTNSSLLTENIDGRYFYFVHSYVAQNYDPSDVDLVANYGSIFPVLVEGPGIAGTQFHPEKSGESGSLFLDNLIRWLRR